MSTWAWKKLHREDNLRWRRESYHRNKAKYRPKIKERKDITGKFVQEYKSTQACAKCGENDPVCLDFHHLDPKNKSDRVSAAKTHGWSIERTKKEIAKCVILCANCHRKEEYAKRQLNSN